GRSPACVASGVLLQPPANATCVERSRDAKRPGKGPPPLGLRQAVQIGVNPRSPTRLSPPKIENQGPVYDRDAQQLTGHRRAPAPDTGPDRAGAWGTCGNRFGAVNHGKSISCFGFVVVGGWWVGRASQPNRMPLPLPRHRFG